MPYFTRIFGADERVPSFQALRDAVAQWTATVQTEDDEPEWEVAELLYDEEALPVDIERYLPATDGLFEEDIQEFRASVEGMEEGSARDRILELFQTTRQIISFRVPDEADDTVFGPLNAAMDALYQYVGGLIHAEGEGFYEGTDLILPTD